MTSEIQKFQEEINKELSNQETMNALIDTTFKGLSPDNVRKAIMAGMVMGFTFKNFLQKDVYAIPYGGNFSLVTSIDYARKIAQRSGIIGSPKQDWDLAESGKPVSCTVTVQKKVHDTIGDFSATVFFDEFNTGKNQWATKPKHMLGKVAEMHALRKAFPEEMAQMYAEEEMHKESEKFVAVDALRPIDFYLTGINTARNKDELVKAWAEFNKVKTKFSEEEIQKMIAAKDAAKAKIEASMAILEKIDEETISYDNL